MLFLALVLACNNSDSESGKKITGEWDAHSTMDGQPFNLLVRFKDNGVVDVMGNGKLIVSQDYRVTGDSIIFSGDPNCIPTSQGVYRYTFHKDSVRFDLLADTCSMRIQSTDQVSLARVTTSK